MGLFWVFAEMVILIFIRQGIAFIEGKASKMMGFIIVSALIFFLLFLTAFWGDTFFSDYLDFAHAINLHFYEYALWHLFCTMWVILEGCIMFYALHAYRVLKYAIHNYSHARAKGMHPLTRYGVPLFLTAAVAFYLFYEYQVFAIIQRYRIHTQNLNSMYLFYIKICGTLWFVIEGSVAILGWKTYQLLKQHQQ